MKTLYLDRSTGACRDGAWIEKLDLDGVDRIVVGTGPGSFAGIRSALAFAQGYALGKKCEVFGLPSACAVAAQVYAAKPSVKSLAVVGDSRRGMAWVAVFRGYSLEKDVFRVKQSDFSGPVPKETGPVPRDCMVVTPDGKRIGELLAGAFADRYLGDVQPTDEGLRLFAEANPQILRPEPLPIYLNPAVQ